MPALDSKWFVKIKFKKQRIPQYIGGKTSHYTPLTRRMNVEETRDEQALDFWIINVVDSQINGTIKRKFLPNPNTRGPR